MEVLGPFASVDKGEAQYRSGRSIDAAVLDINLQGQSVFSFADELLADHVPFLFSTGYDGDAIPTRFSRIPRYEKPIRVDRLAGELDAIIKA
ncbi:response regulator [Novosphingobium sp. 9]|uniref:response regulator n=1 Tax=Novosphingobium sp. 9 TaxID=2025349 RepID=UPI0021B62AEB|nr:response regulator [Novosphingobium sp. 9]